MNSHRILHIGFIPTLLFACSLVASAGAFDPVQQDFTQCLVINGFTAGASFEEPSSVAIDERTGSMYIADTKAGTISQFTLQGVPVNQLGTSENLKSPFGIAIDGKGNIFVSEDDKASIKIINSKGESSSLEVSSGDGSVSAKPGRMTFDGDGNLYVVDRATNRILIFDKDRKFVIAIGSAGTKRGQFKALQDVAVDRHGRIYALDSSGFPVQVFDKKGKYLYRFGFQGDDPQDLSFASSLFIDRNDQIWIVDKGQNALKVFDRVGTFLRKFGTYGVGESALFYPTDAKMDNMGRVYVLESGGRRLQVFTILHPYERFNPPGL